ncbi:MAG TPA: hypothetical protein VII06_18185 [Chloroflexota bacterium]|jgi:hypothetical protein
MRLIRHLAASTALVAGLLAMGGAACGAAAEGAPLFRDAARPPTAPPAAAPPVVRSRYVEVDFDALGGVNASPAATAASVRLNLFPDASYLAERDGAEPTSSGRGVIWRGHLQGVPDSTVTLVAEDGVLAGDVRGAGHVYAVRYVGDGVHAVQEINAGAFPPD